MDILMYFDRVCLRKRVLIDLTSYIGSLHVRPNMRRKELLVLFGWVPKHAFAT